MNSIIGIAWYRDKQTYQRFLELSGHSNDMPGTYEKWQALAGKVLEGIKIAGNKALRVDIDPETFIDWCLEHSLLPDASGRIAYINHVELEYVKTGKGTIIE